MTVKDIQRLDHYQIWDVLKARGIVSTCRHYDGEGCNVYVSFADGTERRADEEETLLHERSVDSYHEEEARCGLI